MKRLVIEGDYVQILVDLLNHMAETEVDTFENNLEEDCIQPLDGVDSDEWEKEVDDYFEYLREEMNPNMAVARKKLDAIAEMSQGNPYCEVVRLQGLIEGQLA